MSRAVSQGIVWGLVSLINMMIYSDHFDRAEVKT
jgi:hypothetical protein